MLPRLREQADELRRLALPSVIVPEHAVDGPSLVSASDLVISAGGSMNREAVALGVPVYTTFQGRMGGVTLGDRPIHARAAGADPRGARHEPRLRARLGAARDRAARTRFLAAIPEAQREDYLRRAGRRRAEGVQRRLRTRLGRPAPVRRDDRRLGPDDDPTALREAEARSSPIRRMRLQPTGRSAPRHTAA